MALCRCREHFPQTNTYLRYVLPIGFPETGAICGRIGCTEPGFVWLNQSEIVEFHNWVRIFSFPTNAIKVKVENEIFE